MADDHKRVLAEKTCAPCSSLNGTVLDSLQAVEEPRDADVSISNLAQHGGSCLVQLSGQIS